MANSLQPILFKGNGSYELLLQVGEELGNWELSIDLDSDGECGKRGAENIVKLERKRAAAVNGVSQNNILGVLIVREK